MTRKIEITEPRIYIEVLQNIDGENYCVRKQISLVEFMFSKISITDKVIKDALAELNNYANVIQAASTP